MATMRKKTNNNKTMKRSASKNHKKSGKKWLTAIDAAHQTLSKTGSLKAAKKSLKKQALFNARKLFGSIGNV